jgi:hypothetical protein
MVYLWLVAAFALFMAAIWSVYAVNRLGQARYGYQPFSLPNAALMLVVNLLLLSAISDESRTSRTTATAMVPNVSSTGLV